MISDELFNALKQVESGGKENAVGDGEKAIGPYQIHRSYYDDAVRANPSLKDNGKTYEDCKGVGSTAYSEDVISSYMGKYATEGRLGREPTDEDIARIHNGGPNGYKNSATETYWQKVKKHL